MHRTSFRPFLAAATLIAAAFLAPAAAPVVSQGDPVQELAAKLRDQGDASDPRLVQQLADVKTRAALEALLGVYDVMGSVYMRREIVRALAQFDDVPEAAQPALQKLTDVATQSKDPELREAALAALGRSVRHGKDFLRMIVLSNGPSELREKAFDLHVPLANEGDLAWYREIYKPTPAEESAEKEKERLRKLARKAKQGAAGDDAVEVEPRKGRPLDKLRIDAFEALAPSLGPDDLVQATQDRLAQIRAAALAELEQRGDKRTLEIAKAAFDKYDERPANRVLAAQVIARMIGPKAAPEFVKRALSPTSAVELRRGLADVLVGFGDPKINRGLVDDLGKGRTHEKLFSLYAVRTLDDERIAKALHKLLADKEVEVVVETCRTLAARKDKEALPLLAKLVEKEKDRAIVRAAIEAQSAIRAGEPGWAESLLELSRDADVAIRTMALETIGGTQDPRFEARLVEALEDGHWSARLTALRSLETLRTKSVIGPIVARMPREEGRMLEEFADVLFRLTGQPWEQSAGGWTKWWQENEATFEILSPEKIAAIARAEEDYQLRQTTRVIQPTARPESKFFGIKIVSHRVIFVVDISGSMDEPTLQADPDAAAVKRMDVAKRELAKSIEALDETAFFSVITFSAGVERWPEAGLVAASPQGRSEALAHVEALLPFGGTNIYGALEAAFADPDVDTILFMSDGEPSVGEELEPLVIRERVKEWNEHRGIVIHTISVGGSLQILEWLAEDTGGVHVKFE